MLPECDAAVGNIPCFRLSPQASTCFTPGAATLFQVCEDSTCTMATTKVGNVNVNVTCTLR